MELYEVQSSSSGTEEEEEEEEEEETGIRMYNEASDGEESSADEETKLLKEVEIVDQTGAVLRYEKMCTKDINKILKPDERILVHVNEYSQPVAAAGGICTRFMTFLVQKPNLCPPDAKNWTEVKQISGVKLLAELRAKFSLPQTPKVDKVILSYFNSKFRSYRHKLKRNLLEKAKEKLIQAFKDEQRIEFTEEELLQALDLIEAPPRFTVQQWIKLKAYFNSPEAKNLSKKGKAARATQTHSRTTGSTSYARKKHEFKVLHKRDPHDVEFFHVTHLTKDGKYSQEDSREFMDVAREKISQKIAELNPMERGDPSKRAKIEKEVMKELMGPDKPGRARGYGLGVTKSQVTDFNIELNRMQSEDSSSNEEIIMLRRKIEKQDQVIAEQDQMIITMAERINDLRSELRMTQTINNVCGSVNKVEQIDWKEKKRSSKRKGWGASMHKS